MTTTEMSEMIMRDIADYNDAKRSGDKQKIEWAINSMENVYIMVCCYTVPGSDMLRKTILEAREAV